MLQRRECLALVVQAQVRGTQMGRGWGVGCVWGCGMAVWAVGVGT